MNYGDLRFARFWEALGISSQFIRTRLEEEASNNIIPKLQEL